MNSLSHVQESEPPNKNHTIPVGNGTVPVISEWPLLWPEAVMDDVDKLAKPITAFWVWKWTDDDCYILAGE